MHDFSVIHISHFKELGSVFFSPSKADATRSFTIHTHRTTFIHKQFVYLLLLLVIWWVSLQAILVSLSFTDRLKCNISLALIQFHLNFLQSFSAFSNYFYTNIDICHLSFVFVHIHSLVLHFFLNLSSFLCSHIIFIIKIPFFRSSSSKTLLLI